MIETLKIGAHESQDDGVCLLEAAAFLAGERHTDHPSCVCPVIAGFCRAWNDATGRTQGEEALSALGLPLVPLIVGTAGPAELRDRRAVMVGDWCDRVVMPAWFRLVPALHALAAEWSALPEATTADALSARAAARDAAGAAAGDAAWAAAGAAAWAAAGDAAGDAARDAARDAAGAALRPVVVELQVAAVDLIQRLCAVSA